MSTRRIFEIKSAAGGFQVYATTTGDFGSGGGLASTTVFSSEQRAMAWVEEQFSVSPSAWQRQTNRSLRATK
jgi:hypothetical protein